MMQEKVIGRESVLEKETLNEAHSVKEIREIIRTIESYLVRTKETIERVEKFVQELKQETSKEIYREKEERENMKDPEKKDFVLKP